MPPGPRIYSRRFEVPPAVIDVHGHVSNLAYVGWMQDVAIEHSTAAGWPMARYLEIGAGWARGGRCHASCSTRSTGSPTKRK
jgi:hypothetical protein